MFKKYRVYSLFNQNVCPAAGNLKNSNTLRSKSQSSEASKLSLLAE